MTLIEYLQKNTNGLNITGEESATGREDIEVTAEIVDIKQLEELIREYIVECGFEIRIIGNNVDAIHFVFDSGKYGFVHWTPGMTGSSCLITLQMKVL
jgi:hypothetical protein